MYWIILSLVICIVHLSTDAAAGLRHGDDDYFECALSARLDFNKNGILKRRIAIGFIFIAAEYNPDQLFILLERYKYYALYAAWNQALSITIEYEHFEHAAQLLKYKEIKPLHRLARESLLHKLKVFLERTPAPCDKPRESWQPELVKSCMRESELARQRARKAKHAACIKLVEMLKAPDYS